jgi:hypothetical protein
VFEVPGPILGVDYAALRRILVALGQRSRHSDKWLRPPGKSAGDVCATCEQRKR